MNTMENKILHYLRVHAKGIANAVSAKQICQAFDITDRELRQVKRNIVLGIDARVGSTKDGYWYAENDSEVLRFRSDYVSRIRKYKEMIDAYENEVDLTGQMELLEAI